MATHLETKEIDSLPVLSYSDLHSTLKSDDLLFSIVTVDSKNLIEGERYEY